MQAFANGSERRVAISRIGKHSARVRIHDRDLFVAIRTYLDSSGKLEDSYLTLAAFIGNDDVWSDFEAQWDSVLTNHVPPAKYVHMTELIRQSDEFDWRRGWDLQNSMDLVWNCLLFMQNLDKTQFRMFYCAIDLEARRKLLAETYQIPDPVELCNQFCSEMVMNWHLMKSPGVLSLEPVLHYFFDCNEYFKQPFEDKWKAELKKTDAVTGGWTIWNFVKQVSAVDMRTVPGVQAADVLAWSVNRESTAKGNLPGQKLAEIMRTIIPSGHVVWDEAKMRQHFKPLIYQRW